MGLLDLFRRQGAADAATAATTGEPVEMARARARRRLIGAVVLLGVGVIAFPLLFETQPRPIPVDIPIQIPAREGAAPLAMPASRPAVAVAAASAAASNAAPAPLPAAAVASAPKVVAPPPASLPAASAEPRVEPTRTNAPAATPPAPTGTGAAQAPKVQAASSKAPAPAAATPAKPSEPALKPGAEAPGRFVVQVGAFAEASAVREARGKLEKLGLPSYTQVVETSTGSRTRVRLGPFGTREDADKAAAKAKAAGLAGTVLAL